jgi:hypothetical protein
VNRWAVLALSGYAAVTAIVISAGVGRQIGMAEGRKAEQGDQARIALIKAEAVKPLQAKLDQATTDHFAALNDRTAAFRELRHATSEILKRPVYRNICLDAAGVQQLDRAADIANGRADLAGITGAAASPAEGATATGRDGHRGAMPDQP